MSDEEDSPAPLSPDRVSWLIWGALVMVGLAVYEFFHRPELLGWTLSLKFAWLDARTGWWLWRRDPQPRRGRMHFWLYAGYGLWKSSVVCGALSLCFIYSGVLAFKRRNPNNDLIELLFSGSCVGGFGMAFLAASVTAVGLLQAWRSSNKAWVNSRVAADRRQDIWPPCSGNANHVENFALASLPVVSSALLILAAFSLTTVLGTSPAVEVPIAIAALFGIPYFCVAGYQWLRTSLSASSPQEAWPEESAEYADGA